MTELARKATLERVGVSNAQACLEFRLSPRCRAVAAGQAARAMLVHPDRVNAELRTLTVRTQDCEHLPSLEFRIYAVRGAHSFIPTA
jgi:hypothetical protein